MRARGARRTPKDHRRAASSCRSRAKVKPVASVLRPSRDIMSPVKRSALMARIKGKNTGPERVVAAMLGAFPLSFETHCRDLPGRPDFACRPIKLAIFVDGDFWHGWRYPAWRHKLTGIWEEKIGENRRRDLRNHARLRRMGWLVLRLWEHQVKNDPEGCSLRIAVACKSAKKKIRPPGK